MMYKNLLDAQLLENSEAMQASVIPILHKIKTTTWPHSLEHTAMKLRLQHITHISDEHINART